MEEKFFNIFLPVDSLKIPVERLGKVGHLHVRVGRVSNLFQRTFLIANLQLFPLMQNYTEILNAEQLMQINWILVVLVFPNKNSTLLVSLLFLSK